jgi:hypothetical protein
MKPRANPIAPAAGNSLAGRRSPMAFQPSGAIVLTGPGIPRNQPFSVRD